MMIKHKLLTGFVISAAITAGAVVFGLYSLESVYSIMKSTSDKIQNNIKSQESQNKVFTIIDEIVSRIRSAQEEEDFKKIEQDLKSNKKTIQPELNSLLDNYLKIKIEIATLKGTRTEQLEKALANNNVMSKEVAKLVRSIQYKTENEIEDLGIILKTNAEKASDELLSGINTMASSSDNVTNQLKVALSAKANSSALQAVLNKAFASRDKDLVKSLAFQVITITDTIVSELKQLPANDEVSKIIKDVSEYKKISIASIERQESLLQAETYDQKDAELVELRSGIKKLGDSIVKGIMSISDNAEFEGVILVDDAKTKLQEEAKNQQDTLQNQVIEMSMSTMTGLENVENSLTLESNCIRYNSLIHQTSLATTPEIIAQVKEQLDSYIKINSDLILSDPESQIGKTFTKYFKSLKGMAEALFKKQKAIIAKTKELELIAKSLEQTIEKNRQNQQKEVLSLKSEAERTQHEGESAVSSTRNILIIICIVAVIISIAIGVGFARSLTTPIIKMTNTVQEIALGNIEVNLDYKGNDEIGIMYSAFNDMVIEHRKKVSLASDIAAGDFTKTITPASDKDELGIALVTMSERLKSVLTDIGDTAQLVANISTQVSDSSQVISDNANRSASSLEEITSSVRELEDQTKQNAGRAQEANQLTVTASTSASSGNSEMQQMKVAMNDIADSSKEIGKIIKVIDDIAFQTNLLALNAAVEAARAGQYGKGFAVVAEEVRSLASRSAKAAQETEHLIESAIDKVSIGTDTANKTADSLATIVTQVDKVKELIGQIATSSNEQANGIGQITCGLQDIDAVTQQNSANSEETASAASELSSYTWNLKSNIDQFKLGEKQNTSANQTGSDITDQIILLDESKINDVPISDE